LPLLKLHCRTLGSIHKNTKGHVNNAALIMHGTGGAGTQFLQDRFAGELFGGGQPFDASKFHVVLIDDIGHGKSSKPSGFAHEVSALHLRRHDRVGLSRRDREAQGRSPASGHGHWAAVWKDQLIELMKDSEPKHGR
jgi:pimeloyl-ACP methyl ester carboxylesterase